MGTNAQTALLMQGTEFGSEELRAAMQGELERRLEQAQIEGRRLRVYAGFDPRTSDLHIGHTVVMRKLRQFQELGHEVTVVVGSYTSLIGDPSDQDRLRTRLSQEEALANGRTYAEQAFRILDPSRTAVRYNHEWLSGLSFGELIDAASRFTVQQFLTREAFRTRWERGDPLYLHETFYSLMQALDACHLRADVQVGGSDQLFNIVTASRRLMSSRGLEPNVAIIMGILPGTDGKVKMSKSLGNHIPIRASAEDMYGKVMSIPDGAMRPYFCMATGLGPSEIEGIMDGLARGTLHPRDAKMRLAREVVTAFHGDEAAQRSEREFVRVFRQSKAPEQSRELCLGSERSVLAVMVDGGLAPSRSAARRLVEQGAVRVDGRRVRGPEEKVRPPAMVQVGKRGWLRLVRDDEGTTRSPGAPQAP